MQVRNSLWYELVEAKFTIEYLALYLHRQRTIKRGFKIFTIVFSASGVLGWKIWADLPKFACGGIAFIQLISSVESYIYLTDEGMDKVSEYRNKYVEYFNKLDELWLKSDEDNTAQEDINKAYFSLRDNIYLKTQELANKIHIREIASIEKKADLIMRDYMSRF